MIAPIRMTVSTGTPHYHHFARACRQERPLLPERGRDVPGVARADPGAAAARRAPERAAADARLGHERRRLDARASSRHYEITTPLIADSDRKIAKSFGVLGSIPAGDGMHDDTTDHTFVLVDKTGHIRFIKDYPKMWIDVNTLLKQLPKVA